MNGNADNEEKGSEMPPATRVSTSQTPPLPRTYAVRKTVSEGLLDFALLMANASQLKALLDVKPESRDNLFIPMLTMIGLSVVMQVTVGVLLLILGSREAKTEDGANRKNAINNAVTGLILFITVVNVFVAAFGIKFSDDGAHGIP
ncbi:hypothetical protein SNE40_014079 [Patella caerulea]|uniref:Ninjurin-2 n=1 Tax=Patella caerulea TaxID=87958 RepID=A0AAN8PC54_PATCE